MKIEKLPEAELDIMKIIWRESTPLKASEIVKLLADKYSWKVPTAHVLLTRLANKGFVGADKSSYFHRFYPIITEEAYFANESAELVKRAGGRVPMMFASLIVSEEITDEELLELSELIDRRLREIKKKK